MTHTPGPWNFEWYAKKSVYEIFMDGDDWLLAMVCDTGQPKADKANAVLIAAVPELLEEGKKLANEVRGIIALLKDNSQAVGWTNVACLDRQLTAFDAIIAQSEGGAR